MKYQKIKNKICIGLVIAGLAILFLGTSLVGADNLHIFFAMTMAAVLCFISATVLFVIKRGSKNEYQQLKDSYMKYNGSTFGMVREDSKAYKLYKDLNPSKKLLRQWDEELLESLFAKLNENDNRFKDIKYNIDDVISRKNVNAEYWTVRLDKAVKEREIRLNNKDNNEKRTEDNKEVIAIDKSILMDLRRAIKNNDFEKVKSMIENYNGILDGETPFGSFLHDAASYDKIDIAKYLIEKGIDVNKNCGMRNASAITEAAFAGNLDMVKLLYSNGAILDVSTFDRNPLFAAIYNNHFNVVEFLVEKGIDLTASYPIGKLEQVDAHEYARQYGRTEIANYLKEKSNQ